MSTTLTTKQPDNSILEKLISHKPLTHGEFVALLSANSPTLRAELGRHADRVRRSVFGNSVYIRGLIEFSNYCKNNCFYCGIRAGNPNISRYRLTPEEIYACCKEGYRLGFRTFVLQSGEDPYFTDSILCEIVNTIHRNFPDCAITLSLGERSKESYRLLRTAGATRYLLRHETADADHYRKLHPASMSYENRMECLYTLKELGYQVGCGFMVGSPEQTASDLAKDLMFIQEFHPHMVGIGPFIHHEDTPFAAEPDGTLEDTLLLLSILRLIQPTLLLPATTALGTIHPQGRELGLKAGANVVMPNLSPVSVRKQYSLYANKICTGEESAQCIVCMGNRVAVSGYDIVIDRGDSPLIQEKR